MQALPHSVPLTLHRPQPTMPLPDSWSLTDKSGSVSCGVTAPGSWCTQGFVCALQESVSPILCNFWQHYGVNGNLLLFASLRSMNQGKLEVVKQEMTRVNIDILGISELRSEERRVGKEC